MPYCRDCGKLVNDDDKFCHGCGSSLKETFAPSNNLNNVKNDDQNSPGYNVLSFFLPLVGLALYFIWMIDYPVRAKGCGKWALISIMVDVILSICCVFILLFFIFLPTPNFILY